MTRPPLRTTRTFVIMEVSQAAHDEIRAKLLEGGYDFAVWEEGDDGTLLDMNGIALGIETAPPNPCLTCADPPSGEECGGCEGAARWRENSTAKVITCARCRGTGRTDGAGPQKPPIDVAKACREECPACGKENADGA